ncbi:MAG: IS66 family transposase [Desulfobacteraceae bacterium]|nr:IS66 family transposase [Desulfobacteraceae bacterium]
MPLKLSIPDLEQLTPERVRELDCAQKEQLLNNILDDLRELHDRLNRTPWNSSCPPSSQPVWGRVGKPKEGEEGEKGEDKEENKTSAESGEVSETSNEKSGGESGSEAKEQSEDESGFSRAEEEKDKKPGRQPGMVGHSRNQNLPMTGEVKHIPGECVVCRATQSEENFVAETGHLTVDVERVGESGGVLGLQATHVKHLYGKTTCPACGHVHRTEPGRTSKEEPWEVELTEWRLVGPMLVSLIVFLHFRMRLSYRRIQEFLDIWLGLYLSTSTLSQCVHEAGRAVEPLEEELVEDIQKAALVHIDETGWPEGKEVLWLWCFITVTTCLYMIGYRSREFLENVLGEMFLGWMMSDGYRTYRFYPQRLRCWAHLLRKARGLAQSSNSAEAKPFGKAVLTFLADLMAAIYAAREGPPGENLKERFADRLADFKVLCERYSQADHEKTRLLAREFLNDWDAIWAVLENPDLPLTNNTAEQALRHWVIARLLSQGTRTPQGTRVFGLLASVIDTCRLRNINPWPYLAEVLANRRQGKEAPPLPVSALS